MLGASQCAIGTEFSCAFMLSIITYLDPVAIGLASGRIKRIFI